MNIKQIGRIIAAFYMFLEIDEEQVIDADDAVKITGYIGYLINELDLDSRRELADAIRTIAEEWPEESREQVQTIPDDFDLDEDGDGAPAA